jgi:uncharacterized protein YraI
VHIDGSVGVVVYTVENRGVTDTTPRKPEMGRSARRSLTGAHRDFNNSVYRALGEGGAAARLLSDH